jgi:hypothetical protein
MNSACYLLHTGFLPGLFFGPEEGGDMFLLIIGWFSTDPYWFLAWLIFRPWRWRRHVPPNNRPTSNGLHGVVSLKTGLFTPSLARHFACQPRNWLYTTIMPELVSPQTQEKWRLRRSTCSRSYHGVQDFLVAEESCAWNKQINEDKLATHLAYICIAHDNEPPLCPCSQISCLVQYRLSLARPP